MDTITNFALKAYKKDRESIRQYNKFEQYITPLVRSKFNIPLFDLKYRFMVAVEVQEFISKEEQSFNF